MLWIKFLIAALIIVIAGVKLTRYADGIAAKTGLSRGFIGLLALAFVTSLPELVVTITAVRLNNPNLAVGDIFGSNLFNLLIIVLLAIFLGERQFILRLKKSHIIAGALSISLMAIAAVSILFYSLAGRKSFDLPFFVGLGSAAIFIVYFSGMYFIFRREKSLLTKKPEKKLATEDSLFYAKFIFTAAFIVLAGIFISRIADEIAHTPFAGVVLGSTFMGTLFLALSTSLPELAVSTQAIRMGLRDMAAGNILGSNMFNIAILPIVDIFFGKRAILSSVLNVHLITLITAILLTAIVIFQLIYRTRKQFLGLNWDIWALGILYLFGTIIVFYLR